MFIGMRLYESEQDGLCGSSAPEHEGGKLVRIEGIGKLRQLRGRRTTRILVRAMCSGS